MNEINILWAIIIMMIVTYIPRVIPLLVFRKEIKNPFIKSMFTYIPYGILAAMIIPDVFTSTSSLISAVLGCLCAVILAYLEKGLMVCAVSSVAVVFVSEQIIQSCLK